MSVYVDETMISVTTGLCSTRYCHLFTLSEDPSELHALAGRIGLAPSKFHAETRAYDVSETDRMHALAAGAETMRLRDFMAATRH